MPKFTPPLILWGGTSRMKLSDPQLLNSSIVMVPNLRIPSLHYYLVEPVGKKVIKILMIFSLGLALCGGELYTKTA